jgi:hypothetical protein
MARTTIQVPDEWQEAAREMDVSLAEYCRRMARAGRRQFGYESGETGDRAVRYSLGDDDGNPGDELVETLVYRNLRADTGRDASELLDLVEDDLVRAADELVADGRAKYRRSRGGWLRDGDE